MSKKPTDTSTVRVQYYDWSRCLPAMTSVAFVLAIALVTARATMGDFLLEAFEPVPGADPGPRIGLPNTTLWLDLLCCIPAILVLMRRSLDRSYVLRFTPAHAMILLLAGWAMASTFWSADRFAAAVTGFHFLSAAVTCWAASQLVRSWQRLRLVAAMAAGVLAILCAHGIFYRTVELPDLRQMVERDKEKLLAERGWTADSFSWQQFQRKVVGGELIGYYASPNTNAAMIVTLGLITAALAFQRLRDRDEAAWPVILLLLLPVGMYVLYYTGSRAAVVTPIIGAFLIWIGWKYGAAMARHRARLFAVACALAILTCGAIIAHGVYRGSLFHDSLTFRWKYWVGSARLFVEHWLTGVGYSNFGLFYLAHRLPEASEEIKDPHNLFVRAFVELGVVGGLLMLGWIVRLAWEVTRPISPTRPVAPAPKPGIGTILAVAFATVLINSVASIDFVRDPAYAATELLRRLLYLGLLILVYAAAAIRSASQPQLDDRPAPLLLLGMIAALAVFIVHSLIDFAFWETGPMHVVALIAGAVLGVRGEPLAGRRKWNRAAVALAGTSLTLWLVAAVSFVMPIADAENRAQAGDEAVRKGELPRAISGYKAAFDNSPVRNADYAFRAARALMMENHDPRQIDLWLSQAIAANPTDGGFRALRATFNLAQPPEAQNRRQIAADLWAAVALDPNSLPTRLKLAEALEIFGDRGSARAQYDEIIKRNDKLNPDEPKRLRATDIDRIWLKIEALR